MTLHWSDTVLPILGAILADRLTARARRQLGPHAPDREWRAHLIGLLQTTIILGCIVAAQLLGGVILSVEQERKDVPNSSVEAGGVPTGGQDR